MKKLFLLIVCVFCAYSSSWADNSCDFTVLIEGNSDALAGQIRVSGKSNEPLDTIALQQYIDEGYRIVDVGDTKDGWSIMLTKNSHITNQWFKYTEDFPVDWIADMLKAKHQASAALIIGGKVFAVMSDDPSITGPQAFCFNYLDDITEEYDRAHAKGYVVTFAHPFEDTYIWIMGKSSLRKEQEAFVVEMNDLMPALDEIVYSQGYAVHNIVNASPYFIVFYGTPNALDGGDKQTVTVNPENLDRLIDQHSYQGSCVAHLSGCEGLILASNGDDEPLASCLVYQYSDYRASNGAVKLFSAVFGEGHRDDPYNKDCPECGGDGKCRHCYGTGYNDDRECSYCWGDGHCTKCNGSGEVERTKREQREFAERKAVEEAEEAQRAFTLSDRWKPIRFRFNADPNAKKTKASDGIDIFDVLDIFF